MVGRGRVLTFSVVFPISLKEPAAYCEKVIGSSCWLSLFFFYHLSKIWNFCVGIPSCRPSHPVFIIFYMVSAWWYLCLFLKIVPLLPKWNSKQALEKRWESLYFLIFFLYRKINISQQNKILSFSSMRLLDLQMEIILFWTFHLELYFLPLVL